MERERALLVCTASFDDEAFGREKKKEFGTTVIDLAQLDSELLQSERETQNASSTTRKINNRCIEETFNV